MHKNFHCKNYYVALIHNNHKKYFMKKIVFITLLVLCQVFIWSCNNDQNVNISIEDYNAIKKQLEDCQKENYELSNTPEMRMLEIKDKYNNELYADAELLISDLKKVYPASDETKEAEKILDQIEKIKKLEKEEKERKMALGFKAIKASYNQECEDLKLNFTTITNANTWGFDNYGTSYFYQTAERGKTYIIAKVTITADNKYPLLPLLSVYELIEGKLKKICDLQYRFTSWKDYGAYLGNYSDTRNDFVYTSTINFTCGAQINQESINNNAVFVVMQNKGCCKRKSNEYGNPPIYYDCKDCSANKELTVDSFDNDYKLLKIFNIGKI